MIDLIVGVSRFMSRYTKFVEMLAWIQDYCSSGRTRFRSTAITAAGNRCEIINIGRVLRLMCCRDLGTITGQGTKYQLMVQRYRSGQELGTLWFKFKLKTVDRCLIL